MWRVVRGLARTAVRVREVVGVVRDLAGQIDIGLDRPSGARVDVSFRAVGSGRGIARMLGTVAGAGITLMLAKLLPFPAWVLPTLVVSSAFGCYALQAVNYAAFSAFITLYIVFLFRFGGFSETAAAHIRLVNTVVGGSLALMIDAIWKAAKTRHGLFRPGNADSVQ